MNNKKDWSEIAVRPEVIEYARKILADHNCDEYTYGDEPGETVLSDLKEGYPDGMEFPYIDVANAIILISKRRPLVRAEWRLIWDTDSCCDGFDCESEGQAMCYAEDTLVEWMVAWVSENAPGAKSDDEIAAHLTEEQMDDWDYMIYNCSAHVEKYDPDTDEYEEYAWPDEDELRWKDSYELGWRKEEPNR